MTLAVWLKLKHVPDDQANLQSDWSKFSLELSARIEGSAVKCCAMASAADAAFLAVTLIALSRTKEIKRSDAGQRIGSYKLRNRFTHEHLLNVLREKEPEDYKNFLRMDQESFDILLNLVRPKIEKRTLDIRPIIYSYKINENHMYKPYFILFLVGIQYFPNIFFSVLYIYWNNYEINVMFNPLCSFLNYF